MTMLNNIVVILLFGGNLLTVVGGERYEVNTESADCDRSQPWELTDDDVLYMFGEPRQSSIQGRGQCIVRVRVPGNRRVRIYISHIALQDCGNKVEVLNQIQTLANPTDIITCSTKEGTEYVTLYNEATIRFIKISSVSTYRIELKITTDQSPHIDEEGGGNFKESAARNEITPGAIAGIAAGSVLFFCVVVGVGIAVWCKKVRNR